MDTGKYSLQAMTKMLESELAGPLPPRLMGVLRETYEGYAGQFRTSRNPQHRVPFIVHPVGVARLAIKYFPIAQNLTDDIETVACVALAHDLLEDTRVPSSRLGEQAGLKVRAHVEALTKPPAAIAGKTGDERNNELLRNILRAGPTTVFVKICDSMHNLASPAFTPVDLLSKATEKAKSQYLPLLDNCPLGEPFRVLYVTIIENAEKALAEETKFARPIPAVSTLDDAVRECVAASAGKVLELHDITAILKRICSLQNIACWRLKSSVAGIFELVENTASEPRSLHWAAADLTESPQLFKQAAAQKISAAFAIEKPDAVITVPFRTDADTSFVLAIALGPGTWHTWINKDTVSLLVQCLAHRLILSESDRRGRLATEAANLGLQVRTDVAARLGVQPAQLMELCHWRLRCQQAVADVSHAVSLILMRAGDSIQLAQDIKIESRVKTTDSILLKMLKTRTHWPHYESIEDIAGVRVICPTQAGVTQMELALLSPTAGLRLNPQFKDPRRDYVAKPTSDGYRALHLVLEVQTSLGVDGTRSVPCELQLRTMFQDTWAKISHALAYHAGPGAKWHSEQLKKLSMTLQSYEETSETPQNQ